MDNLSNPTTRATPKVSVITTLQFPRHRPLECLLSWTKGQEFPQDEIELIVVANGRRRSLENEVRGILRPQDQMVTVDTTNEMQLYDVGGRTARGEWLMFTEPHCIAEPDCLRALLDHVIPRNLAGACVRTLPTEETSPVARMEARMYLEDAATWTQEGDWRKFTKRGTMVRKDAFEAAGGFDARHLRYAEITFAAALHEGGYVMGFAPEAAITHFNSTDLGELLGYVWEYRRQEMRMSEGASASTDGDAALAGLMSRRNWHDRLRGILKRPLRKALRGMRLPENRAVARSMAGLMLPRAMARGAKRGASVMRAAWRFGGACCRFYLPGKSDEARYAAYKHVWQSFGDLSAATAPQKAQDQVSEPELLPGPVCMVGAASPPGIAGFQDAEHYEGSSFRWTTAISVLRFASQPEAPMVSLNVLAVRPLKPKQVTVLWNKTRLSFDAARSTPTTWFFGPKKRTDGPAMRRPDGDWLTIVCPPWSSNKKEHRVLGLPLVSVELLAPRHADVPQEAIPAQKG